jgi:predicted NAD-dependent protein-ADP-ribosyltransferase YbiA (DUF1768 family)
MKNFLKINNKYYIIMISFVNNVIDSKLFSHSRCNPITKNLNIFIGAKPIPESINNICNYFNIIIDLTDDSEKWYIEHMEKIKNIKYYNFPIKNGKIPTIIQLKSILDIIDENKKIYIHCNGGHGRAGTIACLFIGKKYNLTSVQSIHYINKCRNLRIDKSRNFIPSPETTTQINLLIKELGIDDDETVPLRTDKSWLRRIKKERKELISKQEEIIKVKIEINDTCIKTGISNEKIKDIIESTIPQKSKKFTFVPKKTKILFYTGEMFPQFSNFWKTKKPIIWKNKYYPTSEHIFQAEKFINEDTQSLEYAELIRNINTPNMAFILGSQKIKGGYPWRIKLNKIIKKYKDVKIKQDWEYVNEITL